MPLIRREVAHSDERQLAHAPERIDCSDGLDLRSIERYGLDPRNDALAVCLVIMALFVGALVAVNIAVLVAVLFVLAMILIIAGLLFLLGEVRLSTRQMREGLEVALEDAGTDSRRQR